jgi:hypothetical protein
LLLQKKGDATKYQCELFVHSYTLKLLAGVFCETLVSVVVTARYLNSKEFNPNADSLETFKCYKCDSHENSLSWFFFPRKILTIIFEILNIIQIIPKVNQHLNFASPALLYNSNKSTN